MVLPLVTIYNEESRKSMREVEFKMERQGLVQAGEQIEISESALPTSYYYTILPAVAMSRNYQAYERISSTKGVVKEIRTTNRGFYVIVLFDEPPIEGEEET